MTNQNSLEDTRNSGASSTALRTLRILKHLAAAPGPALVGEIATDLMEERNAVRRALQALLDEGLVYKLPRSQKYVVSRSVLKLTDRFTTDGDLGKIITAHMQRITETTGMASTFDTIEGRDIVIADIINPSDENAKLDIPIGTKIPVHCSSAGRMMLASEFIQLAPLFTGELENFTDTTVTSPLKLFQIASNELDRGYGHCLDEWMEGVSCVGIAVKGISNSVVGGISIGGASSTLDQSVARELGVFLAASAKCLSRDIMNFAE